MTPREVAMIAPGTVLTDRAPKGWSNLVIKSHPRIAPESLGQLPQSTGQLATLLFTVILADVQANPRLAPDAPFYLSNVAAGLGTRVNGQDMIISSETQDKLGANFGFISRTILSSAEQRLRLMRCIARSRNMAVLDGSGVLLMDKRHYQVVLRYAILVDPRTGRLDTLCWVFRSENGGRNEGPIGPVQWLPPNLIDDCVLHVDSNEFIFGIPNSVAFAMIRIPQGQRAIEFSDRLRALATQPRLTPALAEDLQWQLASILLQLQARR